MAGLVQVLNKGTCCSGSLRRALIKTMNESVKAENQTPDLVNAPVA